MSTKCSGQGTLFQIMSPIQWNPSIMATIGTEDFGHYRGVATNQGFYKYYFNAVGTKVSGDYREVTTHQGWPLRGIPL